jgi:hypothetical protein
MMALPVAGLALALAPIASAAQPTVVFTPTDSAQLQDAVSKADAQPAGTLSVIMLSATGAIGGAYVPTQPLALSGNVEITGSPSQQATTGTEPRIDGGTLFNLSPVPNMFTINSGANVLFKAVEITGGGSTTTAAIQVNSGGTLRIENSAVDSNPGTGVNVASGGSAVITNSDISDGTFDGIENSGSLTLINDTIAFNPQGGIVGPNIHMFNTLLANQQTAAGRNCFNVTGLVAVTSIADDSPTTPTCPTSGAGAVPNNTAAGTDLALTNDNGGPTITTALTAGNPAINAGTLADCPISDQRFFTGSYGAVGTHCDLGSYQTTGTVNNSTAGPVCTAQTPSYPVGQAASQVVNVQDSVNKSGLGADTLLASATGANSSGAVYGNWPTNTSAFTLQTTTTSGGTLPITSLTVNSTAGITPSGTFTLVDSSVAGVETLSYTSVSGNTLMGVTGGTSGATFVSGAQVTFPERSAFSMYGINGGGASNGSNVTNNTIGSSWFNSTTGGANPAFADLPTLNPYPVTDTKAAAEPVTIDTQWALYAENWLGFVTFCK